MSHNTIICQKFYCQRSGLQVGTLEFLTTAGTLPYLTLWNDQVCYHPVFSMGTGKLLDFARSEWERLAQRAGDEELGDAESNILRVSFLALLHALESVKQESPALPPLKVVQQSIEPLFNLVGWKFFLESKRFSFPTLTIAKRNDNLDFSSIPGYLSACWEVKNDYETKVNEVVEKEKLAAAERAMLALRREWVTPVSKKMLWQWVRAHLPEKYQPDADGWLGTVFLGSDRAILTFDKDELEMAEEIIISSCPAGNSIFKAVRERLAAILEVWEQENEAWEVDLSDRPEALLVNGIKVTVPHPGPEPKLQDFSSRGGYIQAHAKWSVAMAQWKKENPQ